MYDFLLTDGLALIPVLYIIGEIIKGIEKVKDKFIPIILLFFGIGFSMSIFGVNPEAIIQGILLTGTTVYGDQILKQLGKDF